MVGKVRKRAGEEVPRPAEEQWQCWEGRSVSLSVVTFWQWKGWWWWRCSWELGWGGTRGVTVCDSPRVWQSPCAPAQPEGANDHRMGTRSAAAGSKFSMPFNVIEQASAQGIWGNVNYYPVSSLKAWALEKGVSSWLWCDKEAPDPDGSWVGAAGLDSF